MRFEWRESCILVIFAHDSSIQEGPRGHFLKLPHYFVDLIRASGAKQGIDKPEGILVSIPREDEPHRAPAEYIVTDYVMHAGGDSQMSMPFSYANPPRPVSVPPAPVRPVDDPSTTGPAPAPSTPIDRPPYGCYNKPRTALGYYAPHRKFDDNGNFVVGTSFIEMRMSRDCRYDKKQSDSRCLGCDHAADPKQE